MLQALFPRGHATYERSPFVQDLEDFYAWLNAAEYSRQCARGHVFRLKRSLERMAPPEPTSIYTVAQLDKAFGADCTSVRRSMLYRATQRAYQKFLSSRGRLTTPSVNEPFSRLRHRYRDELFELRGLSSDTIKQHERTIRDFLNCMSTAGKSNLESITHGDIEYYLAVKNRSVSRQRLQHVVAHLRAFLSFCRNRGDISTPLDVIDTPRIHRDELPPRALAWPCVLSLLRSIKRSSRSGWRDYAILHLMAFYGLRPSEIVSLQLGSIDWNAGILKVEQRKTRSTLTLPLTDRTVGILHRYLKHGRPCSRHPELFLRARCPAGALTRHAVTDIFDKHAARGDLPGSYSAYSLRHAFAMRLLKQGVGVKVIGDLLGHRNLGSTCQYLRLDVDMLRMVALPVPTQARR
jgi:integrase/recombinase XerD